VTEIRTNTVSYTVPSLSYILDIYAPMIYTAPCAMFLMRDDTLPVTGQVGRGLGPGNREFLCPLKWHRADTSHMPLTLTLSYSCHLQSVSDRFALNSCPVCPCTLGLLGREQYQNEEFR
jgi:hypothetical protein